MCCALTSDDCRLLPLLAVKIAQTYANELQELIKQATDPSGAFNPGVYLQLDKGRMFGAIPSQPQPLLSMLAGGLAGAGLGYGLGAVGETVLPKSWQRGKLRRALGLAGGLAGMSPGVAWGLANVLAKKRFNDPHFAEGSREYRYRVPAPTNQELQLQQEAQQSELAPKIAAALRAAAESPLADMTGMNATSVIDVNQWNQMVWNDPRVAIPLTPLQQTAASGLITGAANLPGKRETRFVTPMDVGRMAAGMGSGYISGLVVGKALGALMGAPPETQDRLKNTGMVAGLVANLVPLLFGA